VTIAEFVNVPEAIGATTTVTVALAPGLRPAGMVHVTVTPLGLQVGDEPAETNASLAGSVSVTATFDAIAGPMFVAVRV
jgi:hypothetical protein